MNNLQQGRLRRRIGHWKLSTQLMLIYIIAVFLPISTVGGYLMRTMNLNQQDYYSDLLAAYNDGVKQTLYEITSQIYTISDSIVYNDALIAFLNGSYETEQEMMQAAANTTILDKYAAKYVGVEEIRIYIDRENMVNYGQFYRVTDETREEEWYKKASEQYIPFWFAYQSEAAKFGNLNWNLTLVRKMILVGGEREAVIMIKVRDSYLTSRLTNSKYTTMFSIDDQVVAYSNSLAFYGNKPDIEIDYDNTLFSYEGRAMCDDRESLVCVDTLNLSKSPNKLYLVSYDTNAIDNINRILGISSLLLAGAILLPLIVIVLFSRRFTGQVRKLRDEMGKASRGEYREMANELLGSEELADAFNDLSKMVNDIQRMEAEYYEAQIRNQNIQNEQQRMKFKMLSSQINPHFLYNTLETIRMKALTAGDTEVANATKLLGKSMRYVLENTGMKDTTLQKEVDHVMIYLQIQQLRFGDRVNYSLHVQPELDMSSVRIIPLLLQPIVENAIVHGLEGREADGKVWIAIYEVDNILHIDISDNGMGMSADELKEINAGLESLSDEMKTSSIGLYNINRRIKLNYGDDYGITILSTKGEGTRVTVTVPMG